MVAAFLSGLDYFGWESSSHNIWRSQWSGEIAIFHPHIARNCHISPSYCFLGKRFCGVRIIGIGEPIMSEQKEEKESTTLVVWKVSNQIKSIGRVKCWMENLARSSQRKLSFGRGGWQEVIGALPPFLIYSMSSFSSHGKQFFSELLFSRWCSEV